jgi:anti-sigma factor RsiW
LNDHLSAAALNALVDGELAGNELLRVNGHLAACPQCTSNALVQSLLKSAANRAGQRYPPPPGLRERLERQCAHEAANPRSTSSELAPQPGRAFAAYGWLAAVATLLVCASLFVGLRKTAPSSEEAALVTEVCDQHIAALAANAPPEVVSSDRHTVKPWFQGKLPFSFNLPDNLPADTTLDGANLTYLHSKPTAQLLYSIGRHRVSVFVQQRADASTSGAIEANRAGFHVASFHTEDLEAVAVSDVDPARLTDLLDRIAHAQAGTRGLAK